MSPSFYCMPVRVRGRSKLPLIIMGRFDIQYLEYLVEKKLDARTGIGREGRSLSDDIREFANASGLKFWYCYAAFVVFHASLLCQLIANCNVFLS